MSARVAALSLALLALGPATTSATTLLPLTEVEASVERAFPLLVAARAERDAAAGAAREARGAFNPALRARLDVGAFGYYENQRLDVYVEAPTPLWGTTFQTGYRLGVGHIPYYDGKQETNQGGELRAGVRVPLLRDGIVDRRRTNIRRADLDIELAGLSVVQQRLEVMRAARSRYWDWVAAGQRLAASEELLRTARERDGAVRDRVEHGDLPRVERTDNERAIAQREAQLAAALRALQLAAIELSLYLRDEAGRPVLAPRERLPPALPDAGEVPVLDDALAGLFDRRPEPRRLSILGAQNALELRLARNQLLPGLDAGFFVSKDLGAGAASRAPVMGEVGVVLDVPLLYRRQLGRLDAVRAQERRITAQLGYARDRAVADVRDALSAIEGARERTRATRHERVLARELERLERERFDLGDSTLFMVNLREQSAIEAVLREVDALGDYHRAVAAYQAAAAR